MKLTLHTRKDYRSQGQSNVEYAIIIALIAVLVIVVLALLGVQLGSVYCSVVDIFIDAPAQCGGDSSTVLLQDPFDTLDDWNFTAGNGWELLDGQLAVTQGGEQRGFTGDANWTDYSVQVEQANLKQGNGYGVYFRISNEPAINGYVFQYDPGYHGGAYPNGAYLIRKVVNGNETPPIAVAAAPDRFEWTNVTRTIKVDVRGSSFTTSIDGTTVLQAEDTQFAAGRVGLRSWDSSRATFDDLVVSQ